jgi:hypothetical protein
MPTFYTISSAIALLAKGAWLFDSLPFLLVGAPPQFGRDCGLFMGQMTDSSGEIISQVANLLPSTENRTVTGRGAEIRLTSVRIDDSIHSHN